ncbi:MAG: glycoside hydrolase family 3 protein [Chloroflexi bacterium]|nr:glycoside hydrolase family 3 protein [Chloroflexota bacterium]
MLTTTRDSAIRLIMVLSLLATLALVSPTRPSSAIDPSGQSVEEQVDALLAQMSLRQKVGQLFMVSIGGSQLTEQQLAFLSTYQPGAIVLSLQNLQGRSPESITRFTNELQVTSLNNTSIPLLIAVDQEGGRVRRLEEGFTAFPEPSILGATADPQIAVRIGDAMASEINAVGFNMNLAPVVDLHTRADMLNPYRVLNHRTLSQDPQIVGELAGGMTQGMANAGVVSVLKHYPGHSPTADDSHAQVAAVNLDEATWRSTNLRAFAVAIEGGAQAVMVGHLYYPAIEPVENLPASLSPVMISILRDELGFEGIVMTDALEMGGIVTAYSFPHAALMALQAGVDIVAMGPNANFEDQQRAMDYVYLAAQNGSLPIARVDESVRRVLRIKIAYGLMAWTPLEPETAAARIARDTSHEAITAMFEAGITVVRDDEKMLPLLPDDDVAIIYPVGKPAIQEVCSQYLPEAVFQGYSFEPYDWEFGAARAAANQADTVVVIAENIGWNIEQANFVAGLPTEKMIYVSLWKPYEWEAVAAIDPDTPGFVAAYSTREEAQVALCRVLAGAVPARGRLPMALEGWYELGHGITYPAR